MTLVREFRAQRPLPPPPPERRSLIPAIIGALAAFAFGGLVIFAWQNLPSPRQWAAPLYAMFERTDTPDFSGYRIGRATTAPFLKMCLTKEVMHIHSPSEFDPGTLLESLEASGQRLPRVLGAPAEHAVLESAMTWGEVADCIYRQNSTNLCDIDNRALAVDAGNAFLRQADKILSQPEATYAAQPGEFHQLTMVRDRVLEALRARVRSGVLIAADFGMFRPSAVTSALNDTKPVQNGCAKQ